MFDTTTNVMTRGGRPARIVTTSLYDEDYPIGAIVTDVDGSEEFETYTRQGAYSVELPDHHRDLIAVPETRTSFVNLGYGHMSYEAAQHYHLAYPVLKIVVEKGTNRLVSSEIATA